MYLVTNNDNATIYKMGCVLPNESFYMTKTSSGIGLMDISGSCEWVLQ